MPHSKTIYCNVHREYMSWNPHLLQIIDTPEFQRLRNIKQLGVCHYVFPGATHTRFAHSLGTGYLAELFVQTLLRNQPGCLLRKKIKDNTDLPEGPEGTEVSEEPEDTPESVTQIFKLAGLCHDLGHGPLSHGFDLFLSQMNSQHISISTVHEERSIALLRYIIKKYDIPISPLYIDAACELILPPEDTHKRKLPTCWYSIISSLIDVDKLDYLQRDSMMVGIPSCGVEIRRFFEYARVYDGVICFSDKLRVDVHQLFMSRHRLHVQVYQHPVVRALEHMHIDFLITIKECIIHNYTSNLKHFCNLTDTIFSDEFLEIQYMKGTITDAQKRTAKEILHRIHKRQLYTLMDEVHCSRRSESESETETETSIQQISFQQYPWLVFDHVRIGYRINPVFAIRFFNPEKKEPYFLTPNTSSLTFPLHALDTWYRIYSKKKVHSTQEQHQITKICTFLKTTL